MVTITVAILTVMFVLACISPLLVSDDVQDVVSVGQQ
jgi:hypothetical protein